MELIRRKKGSILAIDADPNSCFSGSLGVKDPTNPHESIASGTRYLRDMLDKFGSTELALWAYNAGPGAVERGRLPAETQDYVPRVLAVRKAMRSLGQVARPLP